MSSTSHDQPGTTLSRRHALRVFAASATAGAAAPAAPAAAQSATPPTADVPADFRVVLHAAQADHWVYVQSNLENLTHEWPQAKIRVVVDGNAVTSLQGDSHLVTALTDAIAAGVEIFVCPNALREHGIEVGGIALAANFSLGGVIALILAHRDGYVYIKP